MANFPKYLKDLRKSYMILTNKLGITNQLELNKMEEKISKQKAKKLFESKDINQIEIGTFTATYLVILK